MLSRPCWQLFRQLALYHALGDAARKSEPSYIQILLAHGADLEYPISNYPHPLNISALLGDFNMVVRWINAKAPLERRDGTGSTPLMNAARGGFYEVCVILVMNGESLLLPSLFTSPLFGNFNILIYASFLQVKFVI